MMLITAYRDLRLSRESGRITNIVNRPNLPIPCLPNQTLSNPMYPHISVSFGCPRKMTQQLDIRPARDITVPLVLGIPPFPKPHPQDSVKSCLIRLAIALEKKGHVQTPLLLCCHPLSQARHLPRKN